MNKQISKKELFLQLANPDKKGVSRWVGVDEFVGDYARLALGNGGDWCRGSSKLAKEYKLEIDKSITKGNRIDRIKTNGFQDKELFNQNIRSDIKDALKDLPCVMLGVNGGSENMRIEIDHKDGRKNDPRVSKTKTQRIGDFQPLCKAANDAKRQICKKCIKENKRFDARIIKGYQAPYYMGGEKLTEYGCVGCYQYDPVKYRETFYNSSIIISK